MKPRALAAFIVAAFSLACGEPSPSDNAGPGLAEPCSSEDPCRAALLCVDGVCLTRPFPPDAVADSGQSTPIDIVVGDVRDAFGDTDGPDSGDGDDVEVTTETDTAETDVVVISVVTIGTHDALNNPGGDSLALNREQAAVAQFVVPFAGKVVGLEVIASPVPGLESCGAYRPAVWVSTAAGFAARPDFEGDTFELTAAALPQTVRDFDGPEVEAGVIRVGLVFENVCPGAVRQPIFVLDDSGDGALTWVWAGPGGGGSTQAGGTFINAATLQLNGRWSFRLRLAVRL